MNVTAILVAALVVGGVGILIGFFLGISGEKFKVEVDEKEVAILGELPGNNCGGCGYAGCSGLAAAIVKGERIMKPETIATAIRIGNPASWKQAENARDKSGGIINFVNDNEIVEAYKLLAATEGILAEPASAASVAGVIKANKSGLVEEGKKIVCILTGNGLKDPDSAIKYSGCEVKKTTSKLDDILKVMNI